MYCQQAGLNTYIQHDILRSLSYDPVIRPGWGLISLYWCFAVELTGMDGVLLGIFTLWPSLEELSGLVVNKLQLHATIRRSSGL